MFEIRRYSDKEEKQWNHFVTTSKNGTFLFDRSYMDYHKDRFIDFSLMVYKDNKLFALLPANKKDNVLFSHGGLTYGGLIMNHRANASDIIHVMHTIILFLYQNEFERVVYKAIPWIYQQIPAEEDLYAIFRECNARLIARNISSCIIMNDKVRWYNIRTSGTKKAKAAGMIVKETDDMDTFWTILTGNLQTKYGASPVHSLSEIKILRNRFPENIRLFMAYQNDNPLGGVLLYVTKQVVHTQYISANHEGKDNHALDLIFDHIINDVFADYKYFDFGKSTEDDGHILNEPLIYQKEGFGGRGVCYDWYEWNIRK